MSVLVGMADKCVMFFCGDAGKGLEPVGVMGGAVFNSPVLHGFGNHIRCGKRKLSAVFHNVNDFLIYILGKSFLHFAECKNLAGK